MWSSKELGREAENAVESHRKQDLDGRGSWWVGFGCERAGHEADAAWVE
jgi:hypothetical protein